jgi:hypothetical protein
MFSFISKNISDKNFCTWDIISDKINEKEINIREEEFVSNFNYFPREKYLEKVHLNGR